MNKIVNLLSVFCFIAVVATSCEKEPILEVSQSSFTISDQGSSQTISFSTNKDWSASVSGGSWCTISPASGSSDVKSITVTVTANDTYDDRSATITIKAEELSKVITISQPKNKAILLTKDKYEVGTAGGSISVELRANIEYDVTIPTENQSWITNTTTKGLVTSNLTFGIAANATYDSRQGKIIIKEKTSTLSDTVYVSQTQKDAIILTSKTYNVADTAITISAELKSNVSYLVTIPTAAQLWITQAQTKALITEQLQFNIARNTAFQARSAEIIIRQSLLTLTDTLFINQAKAPNVPTMTTYDAYNITASSVATGGNITSDGGGDVLSRGVCWSKNDNPTIEDSKKTNGKGSGTFTTEITGLDPATKYYARSYATNRTGTGYGNSVSFTTLVTKPTVTTVTATQITKNSAVTGGNITSNGGGAITQRGVCWSISENPTVSGNITSNGTGSGVFTSSITGLMPVTKYFVRSYATNSAGTSYGEQIEFTTLQGEPIVETQGVKLSNQNSAEVNCLISNNGGSEVTARGVCWSTSDNPSIADNKTNNGTGVGNFTVQISNLAASSTYYVRAYATNSIGTSYSNTLIIKTYDGMITDIDGNTYAIVKIGTQTWMAENLKTTKYRNGNLIGTTTPATLDISAESTPKYQWAYAGNESNVATYGRLYTGFAAIDSRGICPIGWHLPSWSEMITLFTYWGDDNVVGGKLKEAGTNHWVSPNAGATNSSGFTAVPGGKREANGQFWGINIYCYGWCPSDIESDNTGVWVLFTDRTSAGLSGNYKTSANSVRCVKDN